MSCSHTLESPPLPLSRAKTRAYPSFQRVLETPSHANRAREGEPGEYERRWVDLVARDETVTVSTVPVKPTTNSVELLGEPKAVGAKLAKSRGAELLVARARSTDGLYFYDFQFGPSADNKNHELYTMVVAKSKLWSISAKTPEKSWGAKSGLLTNCVGSFVPRL